MSLKAAGYSRAWPMPCPISILGRATVPPAAVTLARASAKKWLGGIDLDVVHEGLFGVVAGHESAVDAEVSVLSFDEASRSLSTSVFWGDRRSSSRGPARRT